MPYNVLEKSIYISISILSQLTNEDDKLRDGNKEIKFRFD